MSQQSIRKPPSTERYNVKLYMSCKSYSDYTIHDNIVNNNIYIGNQVFIIRNLLAATTIARRMNEDIKLYMSNIIDYVL